MLRLLSSRWVRLALAAAVTVTVVAAVLRVRGLRRAAGGPRARTTPGTARDRRVPQSAGAPAEASPGEDTAPPAPGSPPSQPWPPVPILGTPTDADLARHATRPYEPKPRPPHAPRPLRPSLGEAARRRVVRWGGAAIALCVLVFAAQALETAVFSKEAAGPEYTEEHIYPEDLQDLFDDRECTPPTREASGMLRTFCTAETPEPVTGDGGALTADAMPGTAPPSTGDPVARPPAEPAGEGPDGTVPDDDCRPGTGRPVIRKIDPRVTRAVNRQWRRIERWLKTNAPRSHRTLAPPARARTIAIAEAQMGLRFPDDLRASLLRHNGSVSADRTWGFGFLGNESMSVRGIRDTWRGLCEIGADGYGDPRGDWWDGRMIPVGDFGTGDKLVVDSVRRNVGKTDHAGTTDFAPGGVRIRSYHALLKMTADALETGGTVGYWKPVVIDGELEWDVILDPSEPGG
ncbi:hypothetical protein GCM10010156_67370 [Planobispora rosea]|uniref:Knr4/Smi1-like domain-containing protein n=1 Tax=Planobispora rosea TaxID=35762 RepID=A0A8J3WG29_PLARO|nr:SMI1/KNR4 family protein [Planobispora rosea]GGS99833.1 hypothetical protein GCM10010156_67370 [Planobispora rosea]GIH88100.1 hypothetical protein Pro02_65080 [Planobispora rosea]